MVKAEIGTRSEDKSRYNVAEGCGHKVGIQIVLSPKGVETLGTDRSSVVCSILSLQSTVLCWKPMRIIED